MHSSHAHEKEKIVVRHQESGNFNAIIFLVCKCLLSYCVMHQGQGELHKLFSILHNHTCPLFYFSLGAGEEHGKARTPRIFNWLSLFTPKVKNHEPIIVLFLFWKKLYMVYLQHAYFSINLGGNQGDGYYYLRWGP